jgi:hypothetical protein
MKQVRGWAAVLAGAAGVLWSSTVLAADAAAGDTMPSYMLPNIVALIMIAAVMSIACKPYKQA